MSRCHAVSRCRGIAADCSACMEAVTNTGHRRPLPAGCAALHLVPDHRTCHGPFPRSFGRRWQTASMGATTASWRALEQVCATQRRQTSTSARACPVKPAPLWTGPRPSSCSAPKAVPFGASGHERWQRNIAVALGNAGIGSAATGRKFACAQNHPSALVREHLNGALAQVVAVAAQSS